MKENTLNAFNIEFWGDYAMFCRPELRSEPYSYPVPTYAALRNMLQAIYWTPGMKWEVERVAVMNEPSYLTITKMYRTRKINAIDLVKRPESICPSTKTLRRTTYLTNVRYEVTARIVYRPASDVSSSEIVRMNNKAYKIVKDRLAHGACHRNPCFGRGECLAYFEEAKAAPYQSVSPLGDEDFGYIHFDREYSGTEGSFLVAHVEMKNGIIDYGKIARDVEKRKERRCTYVQSAEQSL